MLEMRDRTVLVTGGSGFIGAHLCRRLQREGARVHATSRREAADGAEGAAWHRLDLADAEAAGRLVDQLEPEIVFHLASHVAGARDMALVRPTFEANLASTVHLLEAATRRGCRRFVQVGSLEEPDPGEALATPSSPYAAAKAAASSYARMFHALYGTPVVLARLFMVYGPDQRDLRKLIPYVILSLLRGERPELSSGERPVDWIYVDDVVEGLLRIAGVEELDGQRVDLGTGELMTVRGVVEELFARLAPDAAPPFGSMPDRPMEQVRKADVAATARQLGWQPGTSLRQGLEQTVAWYRQRLEAGELPGA